jgi:hypothetical protein
MGSVTGFLRVLQFPLPIIHSTDCSAIIIFHPTGKIGQQVASVLVDLVLLQPHKYIYIYI